MKKTIDRFWKVFSAEAFTEVGEYQTAMETASITPPIGKAPVWDKTFAAVTFAEAGCPEIAEEFLGTAETRRQDRTLGDFLDSVGLSGVPVCYGTARI